MNIDPTLQQQHMSLCSLSLCLSIYQSVCLLVCIAAALSRAVSVNDVHSEEMLYGLFEIVSLENVVDWVGFVMGGVDLCR
jgi:sulfur relay (sulfurtransferase) complex TusBCD TusD component (DsrE family)